MTVTLTGATGFVGIQILRRLLDSGRSVRVLARDPSRLQAIHSEKLEVVHTGDLFNESSDRLQDLLSGTEILVHAAWYTEPVDYLTSMRNITCLTGTINLAKTLVAVGGSRFVGIGTCAEYDTSQGLLTSETPLAPTTLYSACKASAYLVLRNLFVLEDDVSFAWCRIFYLYGEGENEHRLVPYIRRQLGSGREVLLTHGKQIRDFLPVGEAGRMVSDVALGKSEGAVNICSGEPTSIRQLAERIADEYGRRDLLRFGAREENQFDPPKIVGNREDWED